MRPVLGYNRVNIKKVKIRDDAIYWSLLSGNRYGPGTVSNKYQGHNLTVPYLLPSIRKVIGNSTRNDFSSYFICFVN